MKTDRNGAPFYVHRVGATSYFGPNSPRPRPARETGISTQTNSVLDLVLTDRIYRAFLERLTLNEAHKTDLLARGLDDAQIVRGLYRTTPPKGQLKDILEGLSPLELNRVPGFHCVRNSSGIPWRKSFCSAGELAIPVFNLERQLVNLRIRKNNDAPAEFPKYRYASSRRFGGSGAIMSAHVIHADNFSNEVVITEGEIKAHILSCKRSCNAISIPGVSSWRLALPAVSAFEPELISIAFDYDIYTNALVARSFIELCQTLIMEGYSVQKICW